MTEPVPALVTLHLWRVERSGVPRALVRMGRDRSRVRRTPGLRFAARPVLRLGIILLGLQVTLSAIIGIGVAPFLVAALTLSGTYVAIVALGRTMGVPQPLTRLIAAGLSGTT